ncbi:amino acid adenylation domain-containing protein [Paenibacillus tianmuensis]|uniref:Amino acid adenylation domain-containing protein n=1 Tax=Paenibacillus tianmuensis TaxID=624147 RepID=A0A1G4R926_9BACL|nr:AMP-binding protein [Paenibacillus tianmuensis]SCW53316.1 amino acid adenylation domain-containing protein [Paenibacillus tianmuensis]
MLIPDMLSKAAADDPQKEAFIEKHRRLTFREADEASGRLAQFLLSQGIRKGDRLGIFSAKCIEEIVVILAAMKMGALFVHINPHVKSEQLRHIVANCGMRALFVHDSRIGVLNQAGLEESSIKLLVRLSQAQAQRRDRSEYEHEYALEDILQCADADFAGSLQTEAVHEDDPAAILYTSGSTGKPKGIVVTHRIFSEATITSAQVLENRRTDRLISVTPFSFDGALSQLFTMLYVGGTLVLQESLFPHDIVETMLREQITGFHGVPSLWRMLLQKHSPLAKHHYPHLRYISIIGEPFPHDELMKLKALLTQTKFYMMYGITEAFRSTCLLPEEFERKIPSVGKPLPGVDITVEDEDGRLRGPGEIGEIVHRGAFVSPGYWNDPAKTSEVFRNGALHTGDLGKLDEEGYLYFVGRKDKMLKSQGFRFSPEEVEERLCRMPGVIEAAVIGRHDLDKGSSLKALVVTELGLALTEKEVIRYCKSILPYYMIPDTVEFREPLPKTANLKINRSELS